NSCRVTTSTRTPFCSSRRSLGRRRNVSPAERTLHQLLDRGQRARVRGSDRRIRILFEDKYDHAYWQLGLADRDRFHETFKDAEACGAVVLVWGRFGGDDRTLNHVALKNT